MSIVVNDDFNRSGPTGLGTAVSGQTWTQTTGGQKWVISSGRAIVSGTAVGGDPRVAAIIESGVSDCKVEANLVAEESGAVSVGMFVRASDLDNGILVGRFNDTLAIRKKVAGVPTDNISSTTIGVPHAGDTISILLTGNYIGVYVNGSLSLEGTSSYNIDGTKHGLDDFGGQFDNFTVADQQPSPPSLHITDSFNRPDAYGLGRADSGQLWLMYAGSEYGVSSNQAVINGTPGHGGFRPFAAIDSGLGDVDVSVTISHVGSGESGIVVRGTPDLLQGVFFSGGLTSSYTLYWNTLAGTNYIATTATLPASGDRLRVVANGSNLKCYLNGTLVIDQPDYSGRLTNTYHGIFTDLAGISFDDFEIRGQAARFYNSTARGLFGSATPVSYNRQLRGKFSAFDPVTYSSKTRGLFNGYVPTIYNRKAHGSFNSILPGISFSRQARGVSKSLKEYDSIMRGVTLNAAGILQINSKMRGTFNNPRVGINSLTRGVFDAANPSSFGISPARRRIPRGCLHGDAE